MESIFETKDKNDLVTAISGHIAKKSAYGDKIDILNEVEKVFYFVSTFEEEVNSGGFGSFFGNSYGDFTKETLEALITIDAKKTAKLFHKAIRRFKHGIVPLDYEERQEIVYKLEDKEAWEKLDDKFYSIKYAEELLDTQYKFLMEHKEKFSV